MRCRKFASREQIVTGTHTSQGREWAHGDLAYLVALVAVDQGNIGLNAGAAGGIAAADVLGRVEGGGGGAKGSHAEDGGDDGDGGTHFDGRLRFGGRFVWVEQRRVRECWWACSMTSVRFSAGLCVVVYGQG